MLEILESPTLEKIDACITVIMDYKVEHPHMLWDILIQQLNDKKRTIHTNYNSNKERNKNKQTNRNIFWL